MEHHEAMPILVRPPIEQQPEVIDLHAPGTTSEPPTQEEGRAAAAIFARQEKESATAGAIMAVWAAGMVLPDMIRDMKEANDRDNEEEEPQKKRPQLPNK